MIRLRRALLEFWAIVMMAVVVGFLGPFGTYLQGDLVVRVGRWSAFILGAYVLVRPSIRLWRVTAQATSLPETTLVFWGVLLSSFPLALVWRLASSNLARALGGYSGILPFAGLCALAVLAIAWWAERVDNHLVQPETPLTPAPATDAAARSEALASAPLTHAVTPPSPRLLARLTPGFAGPILALESEDHYVRVHSDGASSLILIRLRDAIAEMDGTPGEQTHRSWWVACDAIFAVERDGRSHSLRLRNGLRAPIARESLQRLQKLGFVSELT